jgi:hypothetical protein
MRFAALLQDFDWTPERAKLAAENDIRLFRADPATPARSGASVFEGGAEPQPAMACLELAAPNERAAYAKLVEVFRVGFDAFRVRPRPIVV